MKNWLATMMCGGLLLAGGGAFGDDMSKEHMAKHDQMMKDCMARQDSSMGKKRRSECQRHWAISVCPA